MVQFSFTFEEFSFFNELFTRSD